MQVRGAVLPTVVVTLAQCAARVYVTRTDLYECIIPVDTHDGQTKFLYNEINGRYYCTETV